MKNLGRWDMVWIQLMPLRLYGTYNLHTLVEHQYFPSGSNKFVQLFWSSVAPSCNLNGNTQAFLWFELNSVTKHLDKTFWLFLSSFSVWQIMVDRAPTLALSLPSFSWQSCCFGPRKWNKKSSWGLHRGSFCRFHYDAIFIRIFKIFLSKQLN